MENSKSCSQPKDGWKCTRNYGHEGPCATVIDGATVIDKGGYRLPDYVIVTQEMLDAGNKALERAIDDQCYGKRYQQIVFLEAAMKVWLDEQKELEESL